jgi:hypothetical protein
MAACCHLWHNAAEHLVNIYLAVYDIAKQCAPIAHNRRRSLVATAFYS